MINYPNKKTTYQSSNQSHSNRGMSLENIINESNEYYLIHNIAIIHKKPIPVQIVKVNYPNRQSAVITEAYYKIPSTTDYNGLYNGYHIDFEAKETQNKTSFPLQNIHKHQIEHLYNIHKQGGISFVIIFFKRTDEIFVLESKKLYEYYLRSKNGRKSISYKELKENGYIVLEKLAPRLDYLKIVDILIENNKRSL
jgi:recombination protein U